MQKITLICVGKLKEKFYADAVAEYEKRLSRYCHLTIVELSEVRLPANPSPAEIEQALAKEGDAIRAKLPPNAGVISLCIEGQQYSSEELAQVLQTWEIHSARPLVFLIGSSNGLHESVKAQAYATLSMSPMTFPHHLARIMLLEQIYRAYQIQAGTKYHK